MDEKEKMVLLIQHIAIGMKKLNLAIKFDDESKKLILVDTKTKNSSRLDLDRLNDSVFGRHDF